MKFVPVEIERFIVVSTDEFDLADASVGFEIETEY